MDNEAVEKFVEYLSNFITTEIVVLSGHGLFSDRGEAYVPVGVPGGLHINVAADLHLSAGDMRDEIIDCWFTDEGRNTEDWCVDSGVDYDELRDFFVTGSGTYQDTILKRLHEVCLNRLQELSTKELAINKLRNGISALIQDFKQDGIMIKVDKVSMDDAVKVMKEVFMEHLMNT